MTSPRDVLNEAKWRHDALAQLEVTYVHRGAPGDVRVVSGRDIAGLGRSFFEIRDRHGLTSVPYHRIVRIRRDGEDVWARRGPEP